MNMTENSSKLRNSISTNAKHFITIRHTLHANPELGFEEQQTAALVVHELQALGLTPIKLAGTGVVAVIDSGHPGKTVALRAELDALPISEQTHLSYQSQQPGKMHACGHDGHTATLLAAASALVACKNQFRGKVKLIFQPAEEACKLGAPAMIKAGVLENPKVDAIFAWHNHPGIETSTVVTRFDSALSGNTNIVITIRGKSGHAATPEHNIDPILIGAAIAQTFPIINQQLSTNSDPITMRITEFNSGTSRNIVPETAILGGTIRTASIKQREAAKQRITALVQNLAQAHGATAEVSLIDYIPPTMNTATETQQVFATARRLLGDDRVRIKPQPARASEDFAFYLEKIPGCYFFIGNGTHTASCHNASYDFNDAILPIAAELLCQIVIDYLMV
ncbi:MAG TPA: amidohydrolase [Gammaproteobacteria bacterium]|nr:amidohydrolase [Gammaproteobacteria bacterium]